MYATEIVVGKMQSASSFQIIEFLRKGIRQSRKTPDCHSEGEVASLDETSRDVARVGPSIAYLDYRLYHRRRRVPSSRVVLPIIAVQLYHLREVGLTSEHVLDAFPVEMESVSRDLETVFWRDSVSQTGKKLVRGFAVSFAHGVCRDQLRFGINCNENPSVSDFRRILCFYVTLFLLHEAPQFITLNPLAFEILHCAFEQSYAAFSRKHKQSHDRIAVQASNSLCAANARAFNQQLNRQKCLTFGNCHRTKQPRMFFRVGLTTLRATKPSKSIAVLPEFPTSEFALGAIHE